MEPEDSGRNHSNMNWNQVGNKIDVSVLISHIFWLEDLEDRHGGMDVCVDTRVRMSPDG